MIGNVDYPGYNANQRSLLVNGRTQMNGNLTINGNISVNSPNIALGLNAGNTNQGAQSIAVGYQAGGNTRQTTNAIAVGYQSGFTDQSDNTVAIGTSAGNWKQGYNAVAIGPNAGQINQGQQSVAIGSGAGATGISNESIAIGNAAGYRNSGSYNVLIGTNAGDSYATTKIGDNNTCIGRQASVNSGFSNSTAIGYGATATAGSQIRLGTVNETVSIPGPLSTAAINTNGSTISCGTSSVTCNSVLSGGSNSLTLGTANDTIIIPRRIRYLDFPTIVRYADGTQYFNPSTDILFQTLKTSYSGSYTGISYSNGIFTNSNAFPITVQINVSLILNTISVGSGEARVVIFHSGLSSNLGYTRQNIVGGAYTGLSTSTAVPLLANETINISSYHTTGASLNVFSGSNITFLVLA